MRQWTIYNQLINLWWGVMGFFPVCWYWYSFYSLPALLLVLAISGPALFIPYSLYGKLQLSDSRFLYESLGVRTAQRFSQNGSLVRWLTRQSHANFRYLDNRKALKKIKSQMVLNEKFHMLCFVFFMCTFFLSIQKGAYLMATSIFLANIVFNVYPILIQQYNRSRSRLLMKMTHMQPTALKENVV